jgi:uncharacterized membrane protein YedE/YeeE
MRGAIAGAVVGVVFGVTLSWSGMVSPDVIRGALLFEQSYLFLMFASAVATAWIGTALLRRGERRQALVSGGRLTFARERVERRHIVGALLFGLGWGIADACPGPIAAQIGQGVPWAVFTLAGMLGGIWLYLRRGAAETEPAADTGAAPAPAAAAARAVRRAGPTRRRRGG